MALDIYHRHIGTVTSTNDYASELLKSHPFVAVSADYQTNGRGRHGKTWIGKERENLYLSIGIDHERLDIPLSPVNLQMAGALIVLKVLRELLPNIEFRLKYPNDVWAIVQSENSLMTKGKISGVITEHTYMGSNCKTSILGIGININQTNFPNIDKNHPVSLKMLTGRSYDIDKITDVAIKKATIEIYRKIFDIFENWKFELGIIGNEVFVLSGNQKYLVKDISENGRLICSGTDSTLKYIDNGDSIRYGVFSV